MKSYQKLEEYNNNNRVPNNTIILTSLFSPGVVYWGWGPTGPGSHEDQLVGVVWGCAPSVVIILLLAYSSSSSPSSSEKIKNIIFFHHRRTGWRYYNIIKAELVHLEEI